MGGSKRTPVINQAQADCITCQRENTEDMVQCDNCDAWEHFMCAHVSREIENQEYLCPSCRPLKDSRCQQCQTPIATTQYFKCIMCAVPLHRHCDNDYVGDDVTYACPVCRIRERDPFTPPPATTAEVENLRKEYESQKEWQKRSHDVEMKKLQDKLLEMESRYAALLVQERTRKSGEQNLNQNPHLLPSLQPVRPTIPSPESAFVNQFSHTSPHAPQPPATHANPFTQAGTSSSTNNVFSSTFVSPSTSSTQMTTHETSTASHVPNSQMLYSSAYTGHYQPYYTYGLTAGNQPPRITEPTAGIQFPPMMGPTADAQTQPITALTPNQIAARKMIKQDLPEFDGKFEDWPVFYTFFAQSTSSCGFTMQENLMRLMKSLKGQAKLYVGGLLNVPENVPYLIERLKAIYGRPEQLIESQLAAIRKFPQISLERMDQLIEYGIAVHNLVSVMRSTGMAGYLSGPNLLEEIQQKLPPSLALQWAAYSRAFPVRDLNLFDLWFDGLTLDACRISSTHAKKKSHAQVHVHEEQPQKPNPWQNPSSNPSSNPSKERSWGCIACKKECKSVSECRTFKEMCRNSKWNVVKQHRLCALCLKPHRGSCRSSTECGVEGCTRKHHPLLHADKKENTANKPHMTHHGNRDSFFRVIPVTLASDTNEIATFAFLDDGSSVTLIDSALADELGLEGQAKPLCLQWTGNQSRQENSSRSVTVTITGNAKSYKLKDVRTVDNLQLPAQTIDMDDLQKNFRHLRKLPMQSLTNALPRILIGIDNSYVTAPQKLREGPEGDPVAIKSRLGWTVYGKMGKNTPNVASLNFHVCACAETNEMIKKSFELDAIGIDRNPKKLLTTAEMRAEQLLTSTTRRVEDNRFETGLLWAYDNVSMPNNLHMAERRCKCLAQKMNSDPQLKKILEDQIEKMEELGYIRELTSKKVVRSDKTWYLPVFPVINPNKPGKVRLVWDAAAKCRGISLNSVLLKGPDAVPLLTTTQVKLRERKIAISGDIEGMFHQVRMRVEDQAAQQFLWPKEGGGYRTFVMTRMTFGASCSPSSAQHVKNVNAKAFEDSHPRAVQAITQNHYVDDWLDSVDTPEEAIQLIKDVIMIHEKAGFRIHQWKSNSKDVLKTFADTENSPNLSLDLEKTYEKLLGMWYMPNDDVFTFLLRFGKVSAKILDGSVTPTKREVLRLLMSVFDPNGFLNHFSIHLKILLQDVWRSGKDWDQKIEEKHVKIWRKWVEHLKDVVKIRIPRCFLQQINNYDGTEVQLHTFVDASAEAYAAVTYIRVARDNLTDVALVGSKSRVAALKPTTIPRLELQGGVIGARYTDYLKSSLTIKVDKCFYWCDSMTVIGWLRTTTKKYKPFVAFRVAEILEMTTRDDWKYVPTDLNPADLATKSSNKVNLDSDSTWFKGPQFLHESEENWPQERSRDVPAPEEEIVQVNVHAEVVPLIDISRFSQYKRLLRATGYLFLWRTNGRNSMSKYELAKAENFLMRLAQQNEYAEEIHALKRGKSVSKSSKIYTFSPYLDENGVLRAETRLTTQQFDSNQRRPIILPSKHRLTELLVLDIHEKMKHVHVEAVVNEFRKKFHIAHLRRSVRRIIRSCQRCKIYHAKAEIPRMAPLPEARVAPFCAPFSHTGVDFFGPITVAVRRSSEKRWAVLFTCLSVRAVHLELASSLNTHSCLMAIRNFTNRRGAPICFYSDRGTNFVACEKILKKEAKELTAEAAKATVSPTTAWKFNPPLSPHMGGAWERLVRTVKTALYEALPQRNPTEEVLRSALVEVENIVNSRPLAYVPIEHPGGQALTPNDFLKIDTNLVSTLDDTSETLINTWKTSQVIANKFWKRWVSEYLPTIVHRQKWHGETRNVQVGDLVVIVDPDAKRREWTRGKVVQVTCASDGRVRQAEIQTATGILKRPTAKLAVLEISSSTPGDY